MVPSDLVMPTADLVLNTRVSTGSNVFSAQSFAVKKGNMIYS